MQTKKRSIRDSGLYRRIDYCDRLAAEHRRREMAEKEKLSAENNKGAQRK